MKRFIFAVALILLGACDENTIASSDLQCYDFRRVTYYEQARSGYRAMKEQVRSKVICVVYEEDVEWSEQAGTSFRGLPIGGWVHR